MTNQSPEPSAEAEVNRIAELLLAEWKRVDPSSGVARFPASFIANFADMARAVVADRALPLPQPAPHLPAELKTLRAYCNTEIARINSIGPKAPDFAVINGWLKRCDRLFAAMDESTPRKFSLGDRVTKTKGSKWTGRVVGFYSTDLTAVDYAVESETEKGSVQIYPEAALAASPQPDTMDGDEDSAKLRIAWWNDMRARGVNQDDAIRKIQAALAQSPGAGGEEG